MASWKDSGVVQDSEEEDEAFESQDLDLPQVQSVEVQSKSALETSAPDTASIWDIPSSPPVTGKLAKRQLDLQRTPPRQRDVPGVPESSPLSSVPDDDELFDSLYDVERQAPAAIVTRLPAKMGRDASPDPLDFMEDDNNTPVARPSAPQPEPRFVKEVTEQVTPGSPFSSRIRSASPTAMPTLPIETPDDRAATEAAIAAAVRYERSLRPRKPIQEHPYLLESAQYTSALRSHGVRPVRLEPEERRRRASPEEDSQEQDYQGDSQNTVSEGVGNSLEDTQQTSRASVDESPPEPDFAPSSPDTHMASPRNTSTPRTRDTNPTSPIGGSDDEELPSVAAILRTAQRRSLQKKRSSSPGHPGSNKRRKHGEWKPASVLKRSEDTTPGRPQLFIPPKLKGPTVGAVKPMSVPHGSRSPMPTNSAVPSPSPFAVEITRRAITPDSSFGIIDLETDDNGAPSVVDLDSEGNSDHGGSESGSASESGNEVTSYRRRARGVLPASHFRLDQAAAREVQKKKNAAIQAEATPDQNQRRGVAVRTLSSRPRGSSSLPLSFLDDSDDSDQGSPSISKGPPRAPPLRQTLIDIEDDVDDDAGSSAMEDNAVEHMVQPIRRAPRQTLETSRPPARGKKSRQPKITSHMTREGVSAPSTGPRAAQSRPPKSKPKRPAQSSRQKQKKRRSTAGPRAPSVGILDVIEPQAPAFLRVAARTARAKRGKGRSSPSRKTIRLATREDQLDAGGVLQDWKKGKLKQRESVTQSTVASSRPPLVQIPSNTQQRLSVNDRLAYDERPSDPALTPHVNHGVLSPSKPSVVQTQDGPIKPQPVVNRRRKAPSKDHARPALLEEDLAFQPGRLAFHKQKRLLDTLYRRTARRSTSPSTVSRRASFTERGVSPSHPSPEEHQPLQSVVEAPPRRLRKAAKPRRLDTTAAQYVHAHDPLPADTVTPTVRQDSAVSSGVLGGLGPFGTHYSQHFEFFPLPAGVYFHAETLVGNGCLSASMDPLQARNIGQQRSRVFLNLNGQSLRWGAWNDEVSSELGILVDALGHELAATNAPGGSLPDAKAAAEFIRQYVLDGLVVEDEAQLRSFVGRLHDVISGLLTRLEAGGTAVKASLSRRVVEALTQILVTVVRTLTMCREHQTLFSQRMGLETLLQRLAKVCVSYLLNLGIGSIQDLYRRSHDLSFRERGIRNDQVAAHAWVVLMRILSQLAIPRMGFWDVLYKVLLRTEDKTGADAQRFEELWRTLFALLPLGEFDQDGVITTGSRHALAVDGWALPQLILKRVFEIYRSNPRQAPSFNSYCRTLVSRCYLLVDEWGWLKSSGVIGTIFDFFASLNLSHLRNEEVGQSPAFLEQLHLSPSLKIDAPDRCFHVFLKLVATTIQRLADRGLANDIKNLVFRILPNHNRQHHKEQDVYQNELAALRNHHDLLCTLFWAAPPQLRPQLSQLERLVVPISSHKEACMINLRAWSQIARFVASKETAESYMPLFRWQAQTFQQLLEQYNSVVADIQQQLQAMSRDNRPDVNPDLKNAIIAGNKAATADVLRLSLTLSLDITRHARTVELAILAGNYIQVQQVFQHFSTPTPEYPWAILQSAVSIIGALLERIERAMQRHSSEGESELENSILHLDHNLTADFFCMARRMIRTDVTDSMPLSLSTLVAESVQRIVTVAGKMAAVLIRTGVMHLSQCFRRGRQCLFEDGPSRLSLQQRRYLPLFLAEVFKRVPVVDLTDIGSSPLHLWLQALVKPQRYLFFERELAIAMLQTSASFIPESAAVSAAPLHYEVNRRLFEYALSWMRQMIQGAAEPVKKRNVAEYSEALRVTMKQMEMDLLANVADDSEHPAYVSFVRHIVSLIKSHGAGICAVPPFFYQVSRAYSPPAQDPQLQVAQIRSYGIRLAEGDSRIAPQLFSFLHNNFKQALLHGRLGKEVLMLQKGFKSNAILAFTLNKMLPAIIKASLSKPEIFVMFDVFCEALHTRLRKSSAPCQLEGGGADALAALIQAVADWVAMTWFNSEFHLRPDQVHIFRKMVYLLNHFQPDIECLSLSRQAETAWHKVAEALSIFNNITTRAEQYFQLDWTPGSGEIDPNGLFEGCKAVSSARNDVQVGSFAEELVTDIDKTWVVRDSQLSVQAPARGPSQQPTQSCQGLKMPVWDMDELLESLRYELCLWNAWWKRCQGPGVVQVTLEAFP